MARSHAVLQTSPHMFSPPASLIRSPSRTTGFLTLKRASSRTAPWSRHIPGLSSTSSCRISTPAFNLSSWTFSRRKHSSRRSQRSSHRICPSQRELADFDSCAPPTNNRRFLITAGEQSRRVPEPEELSKNESAFEDEASQRHFASAYFGGISKIPTRTPVNPCD